MLRASPHSASRPISAQYRYPPKSATASGSKSSVRFSPPVLILNDQPTCIPLWKDVVIHNDGKEVLKVDGVSSDNHMFHPSFKEEIPLEIEPGNNSTMKVLFLPQTVESVESRLYITTSVGAVSYHARARSVFIWGVKNSLQT